MTMPTGATTPSAATLADENSLLVYSSDDSLHHSDSYFLPRTTSGGAASLTYSPDPEMSKIAYTKTALLDDFPHLQVPFWNNNEMNYSNVPPAFKKMKLQQQQQLPSHDSYQHYNYHSTETKMTTTATAYYQSSPSRKQYSNSRKHNSNKEQEARENLVRSIRGKVQPENEWKDVIWFIIFLLQFLVVVFYAIRSGIYSVFATNDNDDGDIIIGTTADNDNNSNASFHIDYQTVIQLIIILGFFATILSVLTMGFMLILARSLLQTALIFTTVSALGWGLIGLAMKPFYIIPTLGFGALAVTLTYSLWVWDRVPFAGINLYTALCGVRSTLFILLIGMLMSLVAFAWFILWSMAFIGVVDNLGHRIQDYYAALLYISMLISLCWTHLVIKNIVQVTVAAAVGAWWFEGDCNGVVVSKALSRSFTKLLGSICLGSLVLIPIQLLRCITCFDFLESYNSWAYTYVGIYGYSFVEAGDRAHRLFQAREWQQVVNDNLIHFVFLMVSIGISGFTGTFGVLLEEVDGFEFTSFHKPIITAFLIGCALGFVTSATLLFGVLNASAKTLLVCFAADPYEFHKHHPGLSQDLRDAWSHQVWEPAA